MYVYTLEWLPDVVFNFLVMATNCQCFDTHACITQTLTTDSSGAYPKADTEVHVKIPTTIIPTQLQV